VVCLEGAVYSYRGAVIGLQALQDALREKDAAVGEMRRKVRTREAEAAARLKADGCRAEPTGTSSSSSFCVVVVRAAFNT
jgi:hypothetical protein